MSTDPGFPGQPFFPDQSDPSGLAGMPGQMFPGDQGFPGQPGFPDQMFAGQAGFPGQPGFPLGARRRGYSGAGFGAFGGITLLIVAIFMAIAIATFVSIAHSNSPSPSGPCVGGPAMGQSGQSIGNGNFRFNCADGGSTVVHLGN